MHYQATERLGLGLSIISPTWFESHKWNSVDNLGVDRKLSFDLDFPMIVSGGISWQATAHTLLAADVRWIDYGGTNGFRGDSGFNPDGSVTSFGWKSIFSIHLGVQHRLNQCWTVRAGYSWNENPIPDRLSFFNVPAPGIVQHHLNVGLSYRVSRATTLHLTYYHAFENSIEGALQGPGGAVPGTSVKSSLSEDAVSLGLTLEL